MKLYLWKLSESIYWWLAFRLPRRLVYFATIRIWAHSSQVDSSAIAPEIKVTKALDDWDILRADD